MTPEQLDDAIWAAASEHGVKINHGFAAAIAALAVSAKRRRPDYPLKTHLRDSGGIPSCGHPDGLLLTSDPGKVTCRRCRDYLDGGPAYNAKAEADLPPRGSNARYQHERSNGILPCAACRAAHAADARKRRAAQKTAA